MPVLLARGMARLVVIDSVAAPFRCEFDGAALRASVCWHWGLSCDG